MPHIMKVILEPRVGTIVTQEISVPQPFSVMKENGQLVVYVRNADDERWVRKVHFVVLETGKIPSQYEQYNPVSTVAIDGNILHIFYLIGDVV